jgi:hypothetical protein
MPQSSQLTKRLPAYCVVILALLVQGNSPLTAQDTYRLRWNENFRREPNRTAARLAFVRGGVELAGTERRERWVRVTIEGWVWAQSLRPDRREGHDLVVAVRNGENLRARPNGRILARLAEGSLLDEIERVRGWVRVRRTGWMFGQSLERVAEAAPPPAEAPPQAAAFEASVPSVPVEPASRDTAAVGLDRAVTGDRTLLRRTPGGSPRGSLAGETPVRVLARSGEWVRVQTEGWVRESELKPSTPGVLVGVTGAEVRSRPSEFTGRVLQWVVQLISVQAADELRPEIPVGRRYLLARGPLPEAGFVYIVVDDGQLEEIERLAPLTELIIVARVRAARSRYLGNPVLELIEMAVR